MLHSITFPSCKCLGIICPILKESFFSLFREWLACRPCSKYDFTSTYGNPLFLEHFHIQTNICFSKRSKTSITSKAVCPAAGLPAEGFKLLCQCYPLVTTLGQKHFLTAIFPCKKRWENRHLSNIKNNQHTASLLVRNNLYDANNFSMDTVTIILIILHMHITNTNSLCGTALFWRAVVWCLHCSLNFKTVNNKD